MAKMKKESIEGKLLALLRSIKLKNSAGYLAGLHKFVFDNGPPFSPFGCPQVKWWFEDRANALINEIGLMLRIYEPSFQRFTKSGLSKFINEFLKSHALDPKLFNTHYLHPQSTFESLFEARSIQDIKEFGELFLTAILSEKSENNGNWVNIYSMPVNIHSPSFELGYEGISVIENDDNEAWKKISKRYLGVNLRHTGEDLRKTQRQEYKTNIWVICEEVGVQSVASHHAEIKVGAFFVVLLSHFIIQNPRYMLKNSTEPWPVVFEYPAISNKDTTSSIGFPKSFVFPVYHDVQILPDDLVSIRKWYDGFSKAPIATRKKLLIAAHFMRSAMTSEDLISFTLFFTALDAIYGIKGNVENSIINGIRKTLNDELWCKKAKQIYQLRNDIVHGGITSFEEWEEMDRYKKEFQSAPENDIWKLACNCMMKFFG